MMALLESRDVIFYKEDYDFVIHYLSIYPYYDLVNGNAEKLRLSNKSDLFKPNVSFQLLVQIKMIEDRIRSAFLTQILAIEQSFSGKLSYYISKEFGVDSNDGGYLKKSNYSGGNFTRNTMKKLRGVRDCSIEYRHYSESLKHYKKNHNHIPPWILINDLMFGEAINWYRCLKNEGKVTLNQQLMIFRNEEDPELSLSITLQALDLLREYRNGLAHNNAINKIKIDRQLNMVEVSRLINPNIKPENLYVGNSNNLKACFICILLLSRDIDQLKYFLMTLEQIFNLPSENNKKIIFDEVFNFPHSILEIIGDYQPYLKANPQELLES